MRSASRSNAPRRAGAVKPLMLRSGASQPPLAPRKEHSMITTIPCYASLFLAAPTQAQFDAGPRTRLLAPLLNEQTYLVVHVDLSRYDDEAIVKTIVPMIPRDFRAEQEEVLKAVKNFQTALTKAGGSEFIVLFD